MAMIEETAKVVELTADGVWVETQRRSACGQCAAGSGCGTAVLGKVLGNRRNIIKVLNPFATPMSVGDEVIIGIKESALVRGSFAVYIVPLLSLFLFAVLGQILAEQLLVANIELMSLLLGLVGLIIGFAWVRIFTRAIGDNMDYQPVVLRKAVSAHKALPVIVQ